MTAADNDTGEDEARISRPGRDGLPDGGPPRARRPRVTVYNRNAGEGARSGSTSTAAQRAPTPARGRAGRRDRDDVRRQRRRRARGRDRRGRRARRHGARARSSSITRRRRPTSRARCTPRRRRAGVGFLDAPVSGGQAGAENGKLTIMVGGDAAAFARAEPVIARLRARRDADGRPRQRPAHEDGQPDLHRRARRRRCPKASHFAQRAGLDAERVLDVIARAPRSRGRWRTAARR